MSLVLDSAGLSALGRSDRQAAARLARLRQRGRWPPIVPTAVLVESLTGHGPRDASVNRLLRLSVIHPLDEPLARRAAALRSRARAGSAVDAVVVATGETFAALVVTGDPDDLGRLARHADGVELLAL